MKLKKILVVGLMALLCAGLFAGCGSKKAESNGSGGDSDKVVIYSNADDEAVKAIKNALDNNGFKGKYVFQGFGTSELGGKILAEGKNTEADLITMSTFYEKSAQEKNKMFVPLTFDVQTIDDFDNYMAPITSQEGAIIVNTDLMKKEDLPMPTSIKDLAKPVYAGHLAVSDIKSSSTAWLLIQALVDAYGNDEAQEILKGIYKNAGDHIEKSGSGPLKLCRAGEVAIGFGLRHQAVADKEDGMPIDFIDPIEGNFSLTESVAVIDKGDKTNKLAMEMAECIIKNGRKELQESYPNPLYKGEEANSANQSKYPKKFKEPLTFELFEQHEKLSEAAK